MSKNFDETYVAEILAAMPAGMTWEQFNAACRDDIHGGYWREANEAWRRYSKKETPCQPKRSPRR